MHLAACSALACVYLVGIVMGSLPVQNSTTSTMRQRWRASSASCFAHDRDPTCTHFPLPPQAWPRVFDQLCFALALLQLTMMAILGEGVRVASDQITVRKAEKGMVA